MPRVAPGLSLCVTSAGGFRATGAIGRGHLVQCALKVKLRPAGGRERGVYSAAAIKSTSKAEVEAQGISVN
mgnify:CR=1 FL=1